MLFINKIRSGSPTPTFATSQKCELATHHLDNGLKLMS